MRSSKSNVRHQRPRSALCGNAQPLPDYTVMLTVTDGHIGLIVAQTTDLERGQVRAELHRLRAIFPVAEGYAIAATIREERVA